MDKIPAKSISEIDTATFRFQKEIINRLKLYDLSRSAILYYTSSQANAFQGYSFETLQSRFKLVGFKDGSQVRSIPYKDMVSVGTSYLNGELADSIYVLNLATFEHWLLWVLRTVILSDPRELYPKSNKQIEINYLKKYSDMHTLWEEFTDEYLSSLIYQGMKTLLKKFIGICRLKESDFTEEIMEKINENSQCRNIIIHNQKKINATYMKKCGKHGKYAVGAIITVTEDLLFNEADNLLRFMQDFRKYFTERRKVT